MDKKGQVNVGNLIILFVGIIFAIAILGQIINTQHQVTNLQSTADEQSNLVTLGCYEGGQVNESNSACNITVTNWYDSGDWRASESQCYISSVSVTNDTGTALTLDTDYHLYSSTGVIQLLNTTTTANSSATLTGSLVEIDYSYCDSGYNKDASSRGIANLWSLFAALIIVGVTLVGIKQWLNK